MSIVIVAKVVGPGHWQLRWGHNVVATVTRIRGGWGKDTFLMEGAGESREVKSLSLAIAVARSIVIDVIKRHQAREAARSAAEATAPALEPEGAQ